MTCRSDTYLCSEGETIVLATVSTTIPQLTLCGETLAYRSLRKGDQGYEATFEKLIDIWAGRTTFVFRDAETTRIIQLDVGAHEQKLGHASWDSLIEELAAISSSLPWGLAPGQAAGRVHSGAPPAVHPAIIESELPAFRRLVARLLSDPPTRTVRTRMLRSLDLSRRTDVVTMRRLGRRPLELAGLRGQTPYDAAPNSRLLLDQPLSTASLDHPITRYVAWLFGRIRERMTATTAALRSTAGRRFPDPVSDTYAAQLADQVEGATSEIEILLRSPLFRSVRPGPLDDSALQALADEPLFAALHRVGRRLADPGLAFAPGQNLYSSLKHSYDLFELLVLYRLTAAMTSGLPKGWTLQRQSVLKRLPREDRPPDGAVWVWRGPENQTLEFRYQPWFSAATTADDRRRFSSLSAVRIPDYVLILWQGVELRSWLILDAKYRSARRSIHSGLGDLHLYRDALRVRGARAAGAFIIVPNLQPGAELYASTDYIDAHDLGALRVYSDEWMAPIWRWFEKHAIGLPMEPPNSPGIQG